MGITHTTIWSRSENKVTQMQVWKKTGDGGATFWVKKSRNVRLMRGRVLSEKPYCKIAHYRSFVRQKLQQSGSFPNPNGLLVDVRQAFEGEKSSKKDYKAKPI